MLNRLVSKTTILPVLLAGILIGAVITTFFYFKNLRSSPTQSPSPKSALLSSTENSGNSPKSLNILLLGYGGVGHDGGTLSDSIMLINLNDETRYVNLLSIPRDLWVPIPIDWDNSQNFKINEAFSIGGNETRYANKKPEFRGEAGRGNLAKFVVGKLLDQPVEYYIAVDFSNLVKTIDLLGGLDVQIPQTFDDFFYPVKGLENEICNKSAQEIAALHAKYSGFNLEKQFTCRYEHLHFDQGLQHLTGEQVLKYVRSRHSETAGGDFSRSQRQFTVLEAIAKKLISAEIIAHSDPLFDQLVSSVKTDMDNRAILVLVDKFKNLPTYSLAKINLSDQNVLTQSTGPSGQFILIPKEGINQWTNVRKYIRENSNR